MANTNLTREQQQIFAINAPSDDLAVIGSFVAGQAIYTNILSQLQSAAYLIGWSAAVYGGNNAPLLEEINAVFYIITYQLAYLFQKGLSEYSSTENYYINSYCQINGVFYRSLTDNNIGNNPVSDDGTNWYQCNFMDMATDAQAAAGILENVAINPKQLATKQNLITSDNMLNADLVDDTNAVHKFVSAAQLSQISTNTTDISGLQTQIDALAAASDVTDLVGTYAQLLAYDTSTLQNNDIVKVLQDENQNNETTYYRWVITSGVGAWVLIGEEGPYYTIAAADNTFVPKTTEINGYALDNDIIITASDIKTGTLNSSLLSFSGVASGTYVKPSNLIVNSQGLIMGLTDAGAGAELVPINILSTSGTITLSDNSVNSITPSGNVIFTLPTISDNTVLHRIEVEISMSDAVYSIDLGLGTTPKYWNKTAPDLSNIGTYSLLYQYSSTEQVWYCGGAPIGAA